MKQSRSRTRMSTITVFVLLGLLGATRSVSAEGRGGTISLGAVSGNTIEVNVTATADGWSSFNVHVATRASAGVTVTEIAAANGTVLQGESLCFSSVPAAGEYVFACSGSELQSITAAGLLARFTFTATGSGCIGASLVSMPEDELQDTYTVDSATITKQTGSVSTTPANILVGTGTATDCPAFVTATTPTQPAPTSGATLPRSGTGDARRGSRTPLLVAATLCSFAAGTGLIIAGRVARRRRWF